MRAIAIAITNAKTDTLLCGDEDFLGESDRWSFQRLLGLPDQPHCALTPANVCSSSWSKKEARRQAARIVEYPSTWQAIVLWGSKASAAFCHERPFFSRGDSPLNPGVQLVSLPNPRSREWHDVRLVHRARQLLREAAPWLPWGVRFDTFSAFSASGYALRCAAECALWARGLPSALLTKPRWTEDELMVALDAAGEHGVSRGRAEYITRVSGKEIGNDVAAAEHHGDAA